MPLGNFYSTHKFPTIHDYIERENVGPVIEEMVEQSTFLDNAMFKPTNEGMKETFKRETERGKAGKPASIDEGYYVDLKTNPITESEFGTMRITEALNWERRQKIGTDDDGANLKAKQMRDVSVGMSETRVNLMLYGNSKAAYADESGSKVIQGLMTYVDKMTDNATFKNMKNLYRQHKIPFKTTNGKDWGERCLAFSNQTNLGTAISSPLSSGGSNYCSVIGVAFGPEGVVTVYPKDMSLGGAGLNIEYHENERFTYTDPNDGIMKYGYQDSCEFEQWFGIGVKNRYCLNAVRNIYINHSTKNDNFDEMERLEENLIALKDFFTDGKTGYGMMFYAPVDVIRLMEKYQKEKFGSYYHMNTRDFDGKSPLLRPTQIEVASGVVLVADNALKLDEPYIS